MVFPNGINGNERGSSTILIQHTMPDIAERINTLFLALRGKDSISDIAKNINDILIYGDKIPINIVSGAWEYFAKRKGVCI